MKTFVALSALVLAVCVMTSQCKPMGNTNINKNSNKNSNFDFISSFLSSMLIQQRKAKALAGRASVESSVNVTTAQPIAETQQDNLQAADETQTPADETQQTPFDETQTSADESVGIASTDEPAGRSETQQDEFQDDTQFKFIQALMAQDF